MAKKMTASGNKQAPQKNTAIAPTFDEKPNHLLWAGGIVLLTFLVYAQNLSAGFVNWDDAAYVNENYWMRTFFPLSKFFTTPVAGNLHPLTMMSLSLNYAIGGEDPMTYHLFNILLHLINTGLAYWLAWRLSGGKFWVAVLTGLLFGIHPMHVESVAWVSERKDVLYSAFYLTGMLVYLAFTETKSIGRYLLLSLCFVLALLSKPAAVTFPVALLLIDYFKGRENVLALISEKIPLFVLALLMGYLTVRFQSEVGATDKENIIGPDRSLFFGFYGFMMYWYKLFFPFNLCGMYPFPARNEALPVIYYLSPLFSIGLGFALWRTRTLSKVPIFSVAFFGLNLILVLQFFIVGSAVMADRYAYIPYWSAFFMLGYGLHWLIVEKKRLSSGSGAVILALLAIGMTILCYRQVAVWNSSEALWDQAIKVDPGNKAYSLRAMLYRKNGELDKAFAAANKALQYTSKDETALLVRSNVFFDRKDFKQAIEGYNQVLEINPKNASALSSRGAALGETGQLQKSIEDLILSTQLDSTNEKSWINRAIIHERLEQYQDALYCFERNLKLKPNNPDIINSIGFEHEMMKNYPKATEMYQKAASLNPRQGIFWLNLARVKALTGDKPGAREAVEKAKGTGKVPDPELLKLID